MGKKKEAQKVHQYLAIEYSDDVELKELEHLIYGYYQLEEYEKCIALYQQHWDQYTKRIT